MSLNEITMPAERVERLASLVCGCSATNAICYCSETRSLAQEVLRLRKIEKAARWFAIAAMDPQTPADIGAQTVSDLLDAFGVPHGDPHAP